MTSPSVAVDLAAPPEERGLLRLLTCGSVDDGKSTLIGRLLLDTKSILADTLAAVERTSRRRGLAAVDLSLLTDGLEAEREQGITIDVAYRYFSTGTRKYIIADAPGHEQYTRNMVTAASTAQLAVLLVDARKGVLTQTRRHAYLAHRLGVRRLVLAVNKLDLVGWSEDVFARIAGEFAAFAEAFGLGAVQALPLCAADGDMVVERGARLGWYRGPTLLEILEAAPGAEAEPDAPLRFPVQWVCRPRTAAHPDFRGYAGRVESGALRVGDAVEVLPSGQRSRVRALWLGEERLEVAERGRSVIVELADAIDVGRGDLLVPAGGAPPLARRVEATLCWLSERPLASGRRYVLRHGARETRAQVAEILGRVDLAALAEVPADGLGVNDVGRVRLALAQPLPAEPYATHRATGAFLLVDEATQDTVAAGLLA